MGITRSRLLSGAAVVFWLSVVCLGFHQLWHYAYTPGIAAAAPPRWPSTVLQPDRTPYTLVLVVHPECPCSRTSLEELSRVLAHTGTALSAFVLFAVPPDLPPPGPENALWRMAEGLPGVTPVVDPDGGEAEKFGALVSGQSYLYDHGGVLLFSGGITAARGHAGDNDGARTLQSIATGHGPHVTSTPVYGCVLRTGTGR